MSSGQQHLACSSHATGDVSREQERLIKWKVTILNTLINCINVITWRHQKKKKKCRSRPASIQVYFLIIYFKEYYKFALLQKQF